MIAVLSGAALWVGFVVTIEAQSILTVAGGGPNGDGTVASAAQLRSPSDVAVDSNGNVYVADMDNHRIRCVDPATGIITTIAGGGTSGYEEGGLAVEVQINRPGALAVDDAGHVYFADSNENQTRRVDALTGKITTIAQIRGASSMTFDPEGGLFFSTGATIQRFDLETLEVTHIAGTGDPEFSGDGGPATEAGGDFGDVALDADGNIYLDGNNRIRRIDAETGIILTIAGIGGECCELPATGDGGPATEARFYTQGGLTLDGFSLFFSSFPDAIRVIDLTTGIIDVHAGDNGTGFSGDGGPATAAQLNTPRGLAIDSSGNLFIADTTNHRIRKVDTETGIISTEVGGGPIGDGLPAIAAQLFIPEGIAIDDDGNLFIADTGNFRVRRVDAQTGSITTVAGGGTVPLGGIEEGEEFEPIPATEVLLPRVRAVDFDSNGGLYLSIGTFIVRLDLETAMLQIVVGSGAGFNGDGGPATEAELQEPEGVAFDSAGNMYIVDSLNNRIRRVDAASGVISTFAGSGPTGDGNGSFSGDGGPATQATLNDPAAVIIDEVDNVFIADSRNSRVRRVDSVTGVIVTVARADDGLNQPESIAFDENGSLLVGHGGVVDRVNTDKTLTRVAGADPWGYTGDGGPATLAWLNGGPEDLEVDSEGNIFIADTLNNRIRAVFACREIDPPPLVVPVDGEIDVPRAPTLRWEPVRGAFRYDVLLNKEGEAGFTAASDLTTTSFTPQNLEEGATYFWRVRAKGDPFCEPVRESLSAVRAFVVIPPCEAPPPAVLAVPTDGAVIEDFTTTLAWDAVPRVSSYDIHLGTSLPPPLVRSTTGTSFTTPKLIPGNTYYWSVTAHASCDPALTTPSTIRSFFLAGPCNPAGEFELTEPADGAGNIATKTTLRWTASENATSYDLFLGTTNPPAIFLPRMQGTAVTIEGLDPVRTYWWQVKANIACDDGKSRTSVVQSFTTRDDCKRPGGSTITFTPPGAVGVGQTYAITWSAARDLDVGGTYVVERSLDADFGTILDAQELTTRTATFLAETPGVHYHRVRPVARCNPSLTGPSSSPEAVEVVAGSANIVFTIEPSAVVSRVGRNLEDLETRFTIENIASEPVQAIIGRTEIASVPFFQVVDPFGGDSSIVTLQPREPKTFVVRFSGPPSDMEAAYQGLVFLSVANSPVIPYAFVNLKVGDRSGAIPEFRVSGTASEYAFFPGLDGDDRDRPPITVEIHNPGTTPMELGAEIGPEVWLEPEPGWNDSPIPAGATRMVDLVTRRNRALNGSALPRYTYFTVRTRTGEAARLLVQDNVATTTASGRSAPLEPNVRSLIVPEVVSETRGGVPLVSKVRLTNLGSDPVQAELVYTPSGVDGLAGSVRRAVIVVPPNDVATLTDPLVQVFGQSRPAAGQIEVHASGEKLGLLSVESTVVSGDRADASFARIPTVQRHDGARAGSPHQIAGITADATRTTKLVLAETSGSDGASLTVTLHDASGSALGSSSVTLERYGYLRLDDLVTTLGGMTPFEDGRITLAVTEGGGSVVGLGKVESGDGRHASVFVSEPLPEGVSSKRIGWSKRGVRDGVTTSLAAPYVVSGDVEGTGVEYATVMGFQSPGGTALEFTARLTTGGQTLEKTFVVPAGSIIRHRNVISDLFGIVGPAEGSMLVISDPRGRVYGRIEAGGIPAGTIDLIASGSELVSMAGSARPLYVDGVEQSTDPQRGSRWNLYVREIAGASGTIIVRLYEAGNRTHPIAVRDLAIGGNERLELETIFAAMGLDSDSRRKDRTNVLCIVTPKSGAAQITAVAVEIDNVTGIATPHTLQPASGLSPSGVTTGLVRVVDFPFSGNRQRPVDRPD